MWRWFIWLSSPLELRGDLNGSSSKAVPHKATPFNFDFIFFLLFVDLIYGKWNRFGSFDEWGVITIRCLFAFTDPENEVIHNLTQNRLRPKWGRRQLKSDANALFDRRATHAFYYSTALIVISCFIRRGGMESSFRCRFRNQFSSQSVENLMGQLLFANDTTNLPLVRSLRLRWVLSTLYAPAAVRRSLPAASPIDSHKLCNYE